MEDNPQQATHSTFVDTNEWVPIHTLPGFESCIEYMINRKGEVKSTKGNIERILKGTKNGEGYPMVGLTQRIGRKKVIKVCIHKLVAFAFLGPPPTPYGRDVGSTLIHHKDENKSNPHADNLQWVTRSQNNNMKAYPRFNGTVRTELTTTEQRKEATKTANREYARRRRQDPTERERDRDRVRQLRADPEYREKEQERARGYDARRRAEVKQDSEKLEKKRAYQREWARRKRALEKAVKIEECHDEK